MPYKSERMPIAGTEYDRLRKLSETQKELIRRMREEGMLSYNQLARMFGVSKRTIQFVCCPEKYEIAKEQRRQRRKDGRYKLDKAERNAVAREHRRYKHRLSLILDNTAKQSI